MTANESEEIRKVVDSSVARNWCVGFASGLRELRGRDRRVGSRVRLK